MHEIDIRIHLYKYVPRVHQIASGQLSRHPREAVEDDRRRSMTRCRLPAGNSRPKNDPGEPKTNTLRSRELFEHVEIVVG